MITEMRREHEPDEYENRTRSENNTPEEEAGKLLYDSGEFQTNSDEYVDIFQVQQLLLDTSTASSSSLADNNSMPKPKVNLQKALEYSTHRLQSKASFKTPDFLIQNMLVYRFQFKERT